MSGPIDWSDARRPPALPEHLRSLVEWWTLGPWTKARRSEIQPGVMGAIYTRGRSQRAVADADWPLLERHVSPQGGGAE